MIPPQADAEFAAQMEWILDTYALPYDARQPVVCMDEQPVQLLKETRVPLPATRAHPRRVDYEYERAGTASLFLFCEPLVGWRAVSVQEQRTKVEPFFYFRNRFLNEFCLVERYTQFNIFGHLFF